MRKNPISDLHEVAELFHKSLSGTLPADKKTDLEKILASGSMRNVYEQLCDEEFLVRKFRELDGYSYAKAFRKLKKIRRERIVRRMLATASVAAAVALAIVPGNRMFTENQEDYDIIESGRSLAILTLADGRTVTIDDRPVRIDGTDGNVAECEGGELSYTAPGTGGGTEYHHIAIPVGGEYRMRLNDGTTVWLNSDSRLRYPAAFTGNSRRVELEGEAYFEVMPAGKPFIVATQWGEITVLGTSFGVSAYPGETSYTTLVEGSVQFDSNFNERAILSPGEQAVVMTSGTLLKRRVDVHEYVAWKYGELIFNDKPLSEIMTVLDRWYGITTTFADESLGRIHYSGVLKRYDTIGNFLEFLRKLNGIRYTISGGNIILYAE